MNILTHQKISEKYCGSPIEIREGYSKVELKVFEEMRVDETGLVHGGFIFGLADYAAMIAVNHPNVVLGAAEVKFTKPVRADERITAVAKLEKSEGKKRIVAVVVSSEAGVVFQGDFICFVLERHVLA